MSKKKKKEKAKILLREGIELLRDKKATTFADSVLKPVYRLRGYAVVKKAFELDDTLYEAYPLVLTYYAQYPEYSKPTENDLNLLFNKWKTNLPEDPIPYVSKARMLCNLGMNQQAFNELKIAEELCAKKKMFLM